MNEDLKKKIIEWNNRFPVDRFWRQKHNVPFNSPIHRKSNFIDQLFEFHEDKMFEEHRNKVAYIPNTGDWLKKQEKSEEEKTLSLIDEARKEMMDLPESFE